MQNNRMNYMAGAYLVVEGWLIQSLHCVCMNASGHKMFAEVLLYQHIISMLCGGVTFKTDVNFKYRFFFSLTRMKNEHLCFDMIYRLV